MSRVVIVVDVRHTTFRNNFINEKVIEVSSNTVIVIDGSNLNYAAKAAGVFVDYAMLAEAVAPEIPKNDPSLAIRYYTALPDRNVPDGYIHKLMDFLAFNGYLIVSKPMVEFEAENGLVRRKGNMDVEIAVDVMRLLPRMKRLIICSGDGDFCHLVQACQEVGVHVTAVSTMSVMATALRRQVNAYIDIKDAVKMHRKQVG